MNDRINDGGPAFPHEDTGSCATRPGMTLRDYFAAKAMHAVVVTPEGFTVEGAEEVARIAYELADAMLMARSA